MDGVDGSRAWICIQACDSVVMNCIIGMILLSLSLVPPEDWASIEISFSESYNIKSTDKIKIAGYNHVDLTII